MQKLKELLALPSQLRLLGTQILHRLATLIRVDHLLLERIIRMQHTIDELLQKVHAQTTVVQSVQETINTLRGQVADALTRVASVSEAQAKLDELFDALDTNSSALSNALVANTPAAAVTPVPVPKDTPAEAGTAAPVVDSTTTAPVVDTAAQSGDSSTTDTGATGQVEGDPKPDPTGEGN